MTFFVFVKELLVNMTGSQSLFICFSLSRLFTYYKLIPLIFQLLCYVIRNNHKISYLTAENLVFADIQLLTFAAVM